MPEKRSRAVSSRPVDGHDGGFDLFHVLRFPELVDEVLGHHGACGVRGQGFLHVAQAVAGVPDGPGQEDIGVQHHIRRETLPFVDLGAQTPLHSAEVGILHRTPQRTVHVQLVPGHLIDGDHGLLHITLIQPLPKLPLFAVPVGEGVGHVPSGQLPQRLTVLYAQFHIRSPDFPCSAVPIIPQNLCQIMNI